MLIDETKLANRNRNRSSVACQNGIVCSSQPLASMAGVDILKSGGNAIDAAICANAMLCVTEPMMCGLGGDLFAIVWIEKQKKLYALNASGRSPYDWNMDDAIELGLKEIPQTSPLSWSVPGCVSGWDELQKKFGTRKFSDLFASAIHYGREGFPVGPVTAYRFWQGEEEDDATLSVAFMPGDKKPAPGDIFKNPEMAEVFEMIAEQGADVFYKGEIAEKIVRFSKKRGGRFSMRDFAEHRSEWVEPVSSNYRGFDIWQIPPNGQGIATLQILNILENFDIGSLKPNTAEYLHLFIEAKKLAYEDRAIYYADMGFSDVPVEELISKDYARERARLIDRKRAAVNVGPGENLASDTTYLTTADSDGNMVSLIQSIYCRWGSTLVPDGLGFALQNRGQLFSLKPGHRNRLEPGKRPFHTIIPAFVMKDGLPVFSFGVVGGDFQPQGQVQILMNMIDFGASAQQAGEMSRVAHNGSSKPTDQKMIAGGTVAFEYGFDDDVKARLGEMGHKIEPDVVMEGGYQGIWREDGPRRYFGASDPRKDGCAIGY